MEISDATQHVTSIVVFLTLTITIVCFYLSNRFRIFSSFLFLVFLWILQDLSKRNRILLAFHTARRFRFLVIKSPTCGSMHILRQQKTLEHAELSQPFAQCGEQTCTGVVLTQKCLSFILTLSHISLALLIDNLSTLQYFSQQIEEQMMSSIY